MRFPHDDRLWAETLAFLQKHVPANEPLIAEHAFLEFFPMSWPLRQTRPEQLDSIRWVVVHKGFAVAPAALRRLKTEFRAAFANEVFVVFTNRAIEVAAEPKHVDPLWAKISTPERSEPKMQADTAAVITTYNRPWALARSLPQVLALGCPVLVVDDGSEPAHEQDCERIRREHSCARLHWLRLPSNRGLPCARNIGLCYWLADPAMEWISAFDDDVDVRPDLFARLRPVQDAVRRPLLTGRLAPEHPVVGEATIHGTRVLFHHSAAGTHFHAHRQYWLEVLPIPTPFLGAPEHGRGSDSDWWVGSFSPNSIVKRGAKIACVPGLVRTFATTAQQSTWGNTGAGDAPLDRQQAATKL